MTRIPSSAIRELSDGIHRDGRLDPRLLPATPAAKERVLDRNQAVGGVRAAVGTGWIRGSGTFEHPSR